MELLGLFVKGVLVGLAIAMPWGPVGLLCLHRSMDRGRLVGLVSGLGVATADALYGLVAALGLTWISDMLMDIKIWLGIGGAAFLGFLGVRALQSKPVAKDNPEEKIAAQTSRPVRGLVGAWASAFLFTLSSPVTILAMAVVFAGMGLIQASGQGKVVAAIALTAGVFSGSAVWWLALSLVGGAVKQILTPQRLLWVNRASGVTLLAAGVVVITVTIFV